MCGISGYLNLSSGVQTGILRRMNDVIRQLYERKSTRVFEDREIPESVSPF